MRMYFCSHCDTGADEIQVGSHRLCPSCKRSLKLTSTTIIAYANHYRERIGERIGEFSVNGELLDWCRDMANEDGSIHLDTLMDLAHDQENEDLMNWLMLVGGFTDYIFLED